jgi:hypothetical protein
MKEKRAGIDYKSLIEKARKDPGIMEICHHEYLGNMANYLLKAGSLPMKMFLRLLSVLALINRKFVFA